MYYYYYFKAFLCDYKNIGLQLYSTYRGITQNASLKVKQKNIYYKSNKNTNVYYKKTHTNTIFKKNTVIKQQTTNTIQIKIVAMTGSMRSGWAVHLFYQRWSTVFCRLSFMTF